MSSSTIYTDRTYRCTLYRCFLFWPTYRKKLVLKTSPASKRHLSCVPRVKPTMRSFQRWALAVFFLQKVFFLVLRVVFHKKTQVPSPGCSWLNPTSFQPPGPISYIDEIMSAKGHLPLKYLFKNRLCVCHNFVEFFNNKKYFLHF